MKEGQKLWTRQELILAVNLYCKLPFGKMHKSNPEVISLGNLIDRTPSAVARKLGNFASFDPSLKERNVGGLPNAGELTERVWDEFYNNWDAALIESEKLLALKRNTTIEELNKVDLSDLPEEGKEKERLVKVRVNQCIFRSIILATYNTTCCITGINNSNLLIASHIAAWSKDEKNRLNPMNGLCLNALHDRAFDTGLLTILAENYNVKISSRLKGRNISDSIKINFLQFEGKQIILPDKFLPDRALLKFHNDNFFH